VAANPSCFGVVAFTASGAWQLAQAMDLPVNTLSAWQLAQVASWWRPVSGNFVLLWSNVAPLHELIVWQLVQSVLKCAALWLGALVAWNVSMWQVAQVALRARKRCCPGAVRW
jgi:hypothetical protein